MPARSFLILHGLHGSGPDHWQSWLCERLRASGEMVAYPDLPDASLPQPQAWRAALADELARLPGERVVVCHSLACIVWLGHATAARSAGAAARVLLVAPPSESAGVAEIASFFPVPLSRDAVRAAAPGGTRLVCSENDPYCPETAARHYGDPLDLPTEVIPGGGHLNADAGYGSWPAVEAWCRGERPASALERLRPGTGGPSVQVLPSASTSSRIAPG